MQERQKKKMPHIRVVVSATAPAVIARRRAVAKAREIVENYLEAVRGEAFDLDRNERLLVRQIAMALEAEGWE